MRGDIFPRNHLKGDFFDHFKNVFRSDRLVEFARPVVSYRVEDIRTAIPVLPFELVQYRYDPDRQGKELVAPAFLVHIGGLLLEIHVVPFQIGNFVPPERQSEEKDQNQVISELCFALPVLRFGECEKVDDFRPGQARGGASSLGLMRGEMFYRVFRVAVDVDQVIEKRGQGIGFAVDRFRIENPRSVVVLFGGSGQEGLYMTNHMRVGECAEIHEKNNVQALKKACYVAFVASPGVPGILQLYEAFDDIDHQKLINADEFIFYG